MIDWKRVTAVRQEAGETEFRPIVELFLDEIEGAIMGIVPGDPASLHEGLQFMKGCGLTVGLRSLCQLCDTWEVALEEGDGSRLRMDTLKDCYAASKQALVRDIDARTAPRVESGAA